MEIIEGLLTRVNIFRAFFFSWISYFFAIQCVCESGLTDAVLVVLDGPSRQALNFNYSAHKNMSRNYKSLVMTQTCNTTPTDRSNCPI